MQRNILISVAAGLLSAVLYLSTKWGILGAVIFALFSPLPLFAAGFGLGLTAGAGAALAATLTVALVAGFTAMAVFAVAYAAPVLLIVRFALLSRSAPDGTTEWYPPGPLLAWLALFGIGVFTAMATFMGIGTRVEPGGLQAVISGYVDTMRDLIVESGRSGAGIDQVFATIKLIFPFIVATWWMMIIVVNGVLAQKMLERRGWSKRPGPDLRTTALPLWLAGVMVAATVAALLGSGWLGFLGINVALILCVPYFFVGLAVLHTVSADWSSRTAILFAAYVMLLLFGWTAVLVTGIGYLEHWAGLRKRFGGPNRSHERKE
jgi:hypothetical protein